MRDDDTGKKTLSVPVIAGAIVACRAWRCIYGADG